MMAMLATMKSICRNIFLVTLLRYQIFSFVGVIDGHGNCGGVTMMMKMTRTMKMKMKMKMKMTMMIKRSAKLVEGH